MGTREQTMEINVLARQGKGIRAIAQEMGLSKNTVRKYLRQPEAAREYGPRPRRGSKLDPFKEGRRGGPEEDTGYGSPAGDPASRAVAARPRSCGFGWPRSVPRNLNRRRLASRSLLDIRRRSTGLGGGS